MDRYVTRSEFRWVVGGAITAVAIATAFAFSVAVGAARAEQSIIALTAATNAMQEDVREIRDVLLANADLFPRSNYLRPTK